MKTAKVLSPALANVGCLRIFPANHAGASSPIRPRPTCTRKLPHLLAVTAQYNGPLPGADHLGCGPIRSQDFLNTRMTVGAMTTYRNEACMSSLPQCPFFPLTGQDTLCAASLLQVAAPWCSQGLSLSLLSRQPTVTDSDWKSPPEIKGCAQMWSTASWPTGRRHRPNKHIPDGFECRELPTRKAVLPSRTSASRFDPRWPFCTNPQPSPRFPR